MITQEEISEEYVLSTAKAMAVSARTAPKARGTDTFSILICDKKDIETISQQLEEDYKEFQQEFLLRDAKNILNADYILLIGTRIEVLGLNCGYCGFATCTDKIKEGKNVPCFFQCRRFGFGYRFCR